MNQSQEIEEMKKRIETLELLVESMANTISRYGSAFPGLAEDEEAIMERLDNIESRLDSIAPEE